MATFEFQLRGIGEAGLDTMCGHGGRRAGSSKSWIQTDRGRWLDGLWQAAVGLGVVAAARPPAQAARTITQRLQPYAHRPSSQPQRRI